MSIDSETVRRWPLTDFAMTAFLRLVALSCLYFGARYWGMLIGYSQSGSGRFDLLSFPFQSTATTLAVLYPVAAIGLWLRASWGPVIWVGIAAIEVATHEFWPGIFGSSRLMSLMIAAIVVVYAALRIADLRIRFKARKSVEHTARALPHSQG